MTDEELIAQSRQIGRELRAECTDRDRLAGWLLKELADRLEGRAAAHAYDADSHIHGRPCTLCGKGPDNPVHRI